MARFLRGFRCPVRWTLVPLIGVYLLSACAPEDRVPVTGELQPGTPTEIDEEPFLQVGVLEGDPDQEFHRVVTPFVLADGRLVVPLAGDQSLRVFTPEGRFLTSLGRRGEGPGEFASLDSAWPRGDSIEAFDGRLHRITRFFPDGSNQVVPLEPVPSAQLAIPGTLPNGWAVMGVADAGMGRRDRVVVHRFGLDGTHQGEVAQTEGMARYTVVRGSGPDPLSPRALFAVGHGEIYVAETLTPSIRVLDPAGTLLREIQWEPGTHQSVDETLRAVVDSAVASVEPERGQDLRDYLEAFPPPDRLSPFWDFIVDGEGFTWVRPFEPLKHAQALGGFQSSGRGGRWLIFSREGLQVGQVDVPEDLELGSITTSAAVGIRRDSLGVESVGVHRLHRR
jgi:hypothetical protein